MPTPRSAKRALDQDADQDVPFPSTTEKVKTPVAYGKRTRTPTSSLGIGGGAENDIRPAGSPAVTSSADVWFETKAQAQARRTHRDDSARRERRGLPGKPEKQLRGSSRIVKSSGFFKQFAKPKEDEKEVEDAGGAKKNGTHVTSISANGKRKARKEVVQPMLAEEEDWDEHVDEYEVPDSEDERASAKRRKTSDVAANGVWKGYVYGKPKKTFEDQIRELEEEARKTANDDASEDELASKSTTARSSGRKPAPKKPFGTTKEEAKAVSSLAEATPKPLDRRKLKAPVEKTVKLRKSPVNDDMEVDESDDEAEAMRKAASSPKPRSVTKPRKSPGRLSKKASKVASYTFGTTDIGKIQRLLLERVTGQRPVPLQNLDDEYAKVYSVINQTITAGESNSMLVIGARGSGKTALINRILHEQTAKHGEDFHAIRLNGFIHTDDKIALREIWRQLGREMELDDNEATSKSYADTMSKLLALLSHPTEIGTELPDRITKSIIFVLDEFELFAGHPRQTLLYNLFDIAQSRKAPIAVLGLTTRIDVAESLEKRVKSRFSHRYVHLSLQKSFQSFEQICKSALTISAAQWNANELSSHDAIASSSKAAEDESPALAQWNSLADHIIVSEECNTAMKRVYHTSKSVPDFLVATMLPIATMPTSSSTNTDLLEHFSAAFAQSSLHAPDSRLSILATLGTLQLALLICAARLTNIYNTELITFALVYEEYKELASKARLQASASGVAQGAGSKLWSKDVAKGAWEELVDCGLILEDGRAGGAGRVDVGLEEIGVSGVELGQWGRWCKEI